MAWSAPLQRTNGTVTFSNARYGFIELSSEKIPISKVYFDSRSVQEGRDCNLSEKYPKGTNVSFTFVLSDGEHKLKYRAINIMKQRKPNDRKQKKEKPETQERKRDFMKKSDADANFWKGCERNSQETRDPDKGTNGWEIYLNRYLLEKGAQELDQLAQGLKRCSDNCPKSLKNASMGNLVDFINEKTEQLEIKLGFVYVCDMERRVMDLLEYKTQASDLRLQDVKSFLKVSEQPGCYLHGQEKWPVGFFNFVSRNADKFVVWNSSVWKLDLLKSQDPFGAMFQADLEAVKYYSQFVWEAPVPISSLGGHFHQAAPEVKAVVSAKEMDFKDFLRRNSFIFEVFQLNHTSMVKCHRRQFAVIDRCWKIRNVEENTKSKKSRKRNSKTKQEEVPINNNYLDVSSFSAHLDKAFTELQPTFEKLATCDLKFSQQCSDEGGAWTQSSVPLMATQTGTKTKKNPAKSDSKKPGRKFYGSQEEKTFKNVIGQEMAEELEKKLSSNNLKLCNLILLRLNVGKCPIAKIYDGQATNNTTLSNVRKIDTECLQKVVRSNQVVKCNGSQQYAVKNTLCSLRVLEQNGKLCGLTIFCQLHEDRDDIGIDIRVRKRLSAVISDPERLPLKYVYNYLRTKCRQLASDNDVLIIDVDGQLSGCNERIHSSLGNVSRMVCASSVDLSEKMTEAVQHSHDYVVVVGVDGVEILEKIQKMCSKGIKVIAEIPSELVKDVDRMFPE